MTANDFFRFCAMGYAENKYSGCDKTPKEQYYLHADGRDDGLRDLNPDDPEAFHAWLHDYSRGGGHPWEVCRGGNSTKAFMLVARCKMQIDIHREQKTVCIWLSRKESSEYKNEKSPILTPLFEGYRKRAYHIAVFMSGSGDLYDSMLGLLLYNRRKMAEKELGVQWPRSRG